MTLKEIEVELLKLDPRSRAQLAEKLLQSLEQLSDMENEQLWAEEALRRHQELTAGNATFRPADETFRDARAGLK